MFLFVQILTLLEGAIKKDFLSSNFETTNELLGYCKRTESAANLSLNPEMIAVLPWIPQTSSAVALRLMELDASISYMLHQKVDCYKDKGAGDFFVSIFFILFLVSNVKSNCKSKLI